MNTQTKLPRLKCANVPWTIAASASNLQLSLVENSGCQIALETFWGHHTDGEDYRKILVTFNEVAAFYFGMLRSDSERGGREDFDWSDVFNQPMNEAELQAWLESNAARWNQNGECPDPKMYIVEGAKWVTEYFDIPKHFLLCSGDSFVELLAKDFTWTEV